MFESSSGIIAIPITYRYLDADEESSREHMKREPRLLPASADGRYPQRLRRLPCSQLIVGRFTAIPDPLIFKWVQFGEGGNHMFQLTRHVDIATSLEQPKSPSVVVTFI
jgi:hypothetical protein